MESHWIKSLNDMQIATGKEKPAMPFGWHAGLHIFAQGHEGPNWSPRQESNLYLALRRRSFYPLNYEEGVFFSNKINKLD